VLVFPAVRFFRAVTFAFSTDLEVSAFLGADFLMPVEDGEADAFLVAMMLLVVSKGYAYSLKGR